MAQRAVKLGEMRRAAILLLGKGGPGGRAGQDGARTGPGRGQDGARTGPGRGQDGARTGPGGQGIPRKPQHYALKILEFRGIAFRYWAHRGCYRPPGSVGLGFRVFLEFEGRVVGSKAFRVFLGSQTCKRAHFPCLRVDSFLIPSSKIPFSHSLGYSGAQA